MIRLKFTEGGSGGSRGRSQGSIFLLHAGLTIFTIFNSCSILWHHPATGWLDMLYKQWRRKGGGAPGAGAPPIFLGMLVEIACLSRAVFSFPNWSPPIEKLLRTQLTKMGSWCDDINQSIMIIMIFIQ